MKSLKLYILEKALERKKYLSNVKDVAPVIMEHVLLIHMYPDAREVNHWKGEIRGNLRKLFAKIKSGNSEAKRTILTDYLINEYYDDFTNNIPGLIFSLSYDKPDLMLSKDHVTLWKEIEISVKKMYASMIVYVAEDDMENLTKYIQAYNPNRKSTH